MNGLGALVFAAGACSFAGIAGGFLVSRWFEGRSAAQRRRALRKASGVGAEEGVETGGAAALVVRYVVNLSRKITFKTTRAFVPVVPKRKEQVSGRNRTAAWFEAHVEKAGVAQEVTLLGFREARFRLACMGVAGGGLVGAVLSNELALLLGVLGAVTGSFSPQWALKVFEQQRTADVERHLSEMLEVVALGLRSGLSFDHSFQLYSVHFETQLSGACASAQQQWMMGLATREEALRQLAHSYSSTQLERVVENMVRSLRFGSSLAASLEAAAGEARLEHRANLEEVVAKAPVKMMLPTGALILPAMLLLVLGPVLLELGGGF